MYVSPTRSSEKRKLPSTLGRVENGNFDSLTTAGRSDKIEHTSLRAKKRIFWSLKHYLNIYDYFILKKFKLLLSTNFCVVKNYGFSFPFFLFVTLRKVSISCQ